MYVRSSADDLSHVFLVLQVVDLPPVHDRLLAQRLQREQGPSHDPFLFPDHRHVSEAPLPQEVLCRLTEANDRERDKRDARQQKGRYKQSPQ